MNLNLSNFATIATLVCTAVAGTWVALSQIHDKIDKTQDKPRHGHGSYITREEYRQDTDRIFLQFNKIEGKLDKVLYRFHKD